MDNFIQRDIQREIAHHERLHPKQQSQNPPAPEPTIRLLDQVPDQPLTWLWPGRIPQGHLTLLDAAPGSGLSLMALTLAACVSRGSPLPDGTPTQRGYVLLLAPYDSPTDLLKARFQAAGGDPSHLLLVLPLVGDPSRDLAHTRPYAFPQAARSRLLLAPDPSGDGHQLLLTTKHALCTQPGILAYDLLASEAGMPTIHWLGQRDHDQLTRLWTGPMRSPYRQAILRFLQHSDTPRTIPDILEATSYDREAGRKMLVRMKMAGELVSPARGLYTTANHPCLYGFPSSRPSR